jgi:hypothetical protein
LAYALNRYASATPTNYKAAAVGGVTTMYKFLFIIAGIFLISCSSVSNERNEISDSELNLELFQETKSCDGEGVTVNGIVFPSGKLKYIKHNTVYLPEGRYFLYFNETYQAYEKGQCVVIQPLIVNTGGRSKFQGSDSMLIELEAGKHYLFTAGGSIEPL